MKLFNKSNDEPIPAPTVDEVEPEKTPGPPPANDLLIMPAAEQAQPASSPVVDSPEDAQVTRLPFEDGHFEIDDAAVWFRPQPGTPRIFVCSRLIGTAITRDEYGQNWGLVLHWRDGDGVLHEWAMPADFRVGDGAAARRQVLRLGLRVGPSSAARE